MGSRSPCLRHVQCGADSAAMGAPRLGDGTARSQRVGRCPPEHVGPQGSCWRCFDDRHDRAIERRRVRICDSNHGMRRSGPRNQEQRRHGDNEATSGGLEEGLGEVSCEVSDQEGGEVRPECLVCVDEGPPGIGGRRRRPTPRGRGLAVERVLGERQGGRHAAVDLLHLAARSGCRGGATLLRGHGPRRERSEPRGLRARFR